MASHFACPLCRDTKEQRTDNMRRHAIKQHKLNEETASMLVKYCHWCERSRQAPLLICPICPYMGHLSALRVHLRTKDEEHQEYFNTYRKVLGQKGHADKLAAAAAAQLEVWREYFDAGAKGQPPQHKIVDLPVGTPKRKLVAESTMPSKRRQPEACSAVMAEGSSPIEREAYTALLDVLASQRNEMDALREKCFTLEATVRHQQVLLQARQLNNKLPDYNQMVSLYLKNCSQNFAYSSFTSKRPASNSATCFHVVQSADQSAGNLTAALAPGSPAAAAVDAAECADILRASAARADITADRPQYVRRGSTNFGPLVNVDLDDEENNVSGRCRLRSLTLANCRPAATHAEVLQRLLLQDDSAVTIAYAGDGIGMGAFAAFDLAAGAFVAEYAGNVLSEEEYVARYDNLRSEEKSTYFLFEFSANGVTMAVDATDSTRPGRYLNHSRKKKNCRAVTTFIQVGSVLRPAIYFLTTKLVKKGRQLLFDYGPRDRIALSENAWLGNS